METLAERPAAQVWLDRGAPGCEGEPRWQDRDGRRVFTCPDCSLHWYIVLSAQR